MHQLNIVDDAVNDVIRKKYLSTFSTRVMGGPEDLEKS